jgi:FkbM family methyltransferase
MTALVGVTDCPQWWARLAQASGKLMFDIGANGGGTARMFAEKFTQVVAMEPCEESYRALLADRPSNVTSGCAAVSDHEGTVSLRVAQDAIRTGQLVTGDMHGWGETVGTRLVPAVTLDYLTLEFGTPTAVKVDVEGHELQVLHGARDTIPRYPTWYIEVHSRAFLEPISEILHGYTIDVHRHSLYVPDTDPWLDHFYLVAS